MAKRLPKLKPRDTEPLKEDPLAELRDLVQRHRALTKAYVAITNMSTDKELKDGTIKKCILPEPVRILNLEVAEKNKAAAKELESAMLRQLREVPIWQHFLSKVYGCGPVVAAYLVTQIDITGRWSGRRPDFDPFAYKPSAMRRFCGLAVINGHLERRTKGQKNAYSTELRTRLYQMMGSMRRNAAKSGGTTRYLQLEDDTKNRERTRRTEAAARGEERQNRTLRGGTWKALDLFITDLYTVWRALEGLPVWPSYVEGMRGYEHNGGVIANAPRIMSLDEALAHVGDVGLQVKEISDHVGA